MTAARGSGWLHAGAAFVLMGSWALIANRNHDASEVVRAALVQGSLSAVITLGLKQLVEAVVARTRGAAALILPPLGAFAISTALLTAVHVIAGTPEIAATMAVPLVVSTSYAALYAVRLCQRGTG